VAPRPAPRIESTPAETSPGSNHAGPPAARRPPPPIVPALKKLKGQILKKKER
jgi:hypothetical protein